MLGEKLVGNEWWALPCTLKWLWSQKKSLRFITKCLKTSSKLEGGWLRPSNLGKRWIGFVSAWFHISFHLDFNFSSNTEYHQIWGSVVFLLAPNQISPALTWHLYLHPTHFLTLYHPCFAYNVTNNSKTVFFVPVFPQEIRRPWCQQGSRQSAPGAKCEPPDMPERGSECYVHCGEPLQWVSLSL